MMHLSSFQKPAMLAKISVPAVNLNPKCLNSNFTAPSPFRQLVLHSRRVTAGNRNRRLVVVRASYTRTPTGTPGAYQLVDDETGEKFIVWGGSDDDPLESPLPSKAALSWNSSESSTSKRRVNRDEDKKDATTTSVKSDPSTGTARGVSRSFARLKPQRVKAVAQKYPPSTKPGSSKHVYRTVAENDSSDESDYSGSEMEKKNEIPFKRREDKPKVVRESMQRRGEEEEEMKPQRVKAVAQKYSPSKQGSNKHGYRSVAENGYSDESDYSDSEKEVMWKKNENTFKRREEKPKTVRELTHRRSEEEMDDFWSKDKQSYGRHSSNDDEGTGPEISVSRDFNEGFRGWGKAGSSRDAYQYESADPFNQRKKFTSHSDFHSRKTFMDIGCSDYMIESLKKQLLVRPSHIQAMAFKSVIEGKSCIVADQSGSGKTLAYLAPIIQRLRQEELQGASKSFSKCPRVVILVPTAELASQVLNNCRLISKSGVPFRSMVVTGGFKQKTQLENLKEGVDVLIATPGRFIYLIKEGFLEMTNLRSVVLDEVDILCNDDDFEVALQNLISSSPVTAQYLFVTATLPLDIYNKLVQIFPDCEVIMGPGMHRTSPGLEEVLVDCSGDDGAERSPESAFENKRSALLRLVEQNPVHKTIIFCNKIETCRKVENALKRLDRKESQARVLPFHAAVAQEPRLANMKEFTTARSEDILLYLICTDRASRGIDFAGVDHVILFDFPRDPSEYVRRVGRTARGAGGTGKAFVFAIGKQVALARRIMERNQKGHPLHDVPSAYELIR